MPKLLVLADERCGGTNLTKTIGQHPEVKTNDLFNCQELLDPRSHFAEKTPPASQDEWTDLFDSFWAERDIWHLQRYQLPTGTGGWAALVEQNARFVSLYREDECLQYLSWRYASVTDCWHDPHRQAMSLWWSPEDFGERVGRWRAMRAWARTVLPESMVLWLSYEELDGQWELSIARCLEHCGLSPFVLPPAMERPAELDYFAIFGVSRAEMLRFFSASENS
jgi:hypothetical protein